MCATSRYAPKTCTCGSKKPAHAQVINGMIVCFACVMCRGAKMVVYHPDVLNDPNLFTMEPDSVPPSKEQ